MTIGKKMERTRRRSSKMFRKMHQNYVIKMWPSIVGTAIFKKHGICRTKCPSLKMMQCFIESDDMLLSGHLIKKYTKNACIPVPVDIQYKPIHS